MKLYFKMKKAFFTFKHLMSRVYTWLVCSPQALTHSQRPLPSRLSLLFSVRTFAMTSSLDRQLLWSPSSTISSTSACKIKDEAICSYQSTFNRNLVNDDSLLSLSEVTTAENHKIVTEQVQRHSTDVLERALPVLIVAELIK